MAGAGLVRTEHLRLWSLPLGGILEQAEAVGVALKCRDVPA